MIYCLEIQNSLNYYLVNLNINLTKRELWKINQKLMQYLEIHHG